jgi:tetratricopeptide (TPR) repeat protein
MVEGQLEAAAEVFAEVAPTMRELTLQVELRRTLNGLGMCYTGLLRLPEAIERFAQALVIAQKIGDRVATCVLWNNVGVVYHEAGLYEAAWKSYKAALRLLPLTSRAAAPLYCNAARIAMECGEFEEAIDYATLGLAAARESQAWRLIVAALAARADIHIAKAELERAWPLVDEAITLTKDRFHLLADAGQLARLRTHFLWVTRGYELIRGRFTERASKLAVLRLSEWLEARAFEQWVASCEGDTADGQDAAEQLFQLRLYGVIARLLAVGVRFPQIPETHPEEPSALAVQRAFPPSQRLPVPEIERFLPTASESTGSA